MPTKSDLLKRDAELAKDHLVRKAYEAAAGRPDSELKRACDLFDAALHRLYIEEAADDLRDEGTGTRDRQDARQAACGCPHDPLLDRHPTHA